MEAAVRATRGPAALEVPALPHSSAPAPAPARTEQGTVIARGERAYLRTIAPGDLCHLAAWADDPFLERMVGSDFLRTYRRVYDGDAAFFEATLADPTQIPFIIMGSDGGSTPLGLVRLFNVHVPEGYAFLETIIADRKSIRKGCGVEASKLMCAYGLDVLALQRIEAKVYEYNFLSINSLKRNGFRQEGVLRKAGFQNGEHCDVLVFGILRDELEAQRRMEANPERFHFPFIAEPRER